MTEGAASTNLGAAHVTFTADYSGLITSINEAVKIARAGAKRIAEELNSIKLSTSRISRSITTSIKSIGRVITTTFKSSIRTAISVWTGLHKTVMASLAQLRMRLVFFKLDLEFVARGLRNTFLAITSAMGTAITTAVSFEQAFVEVRKTVDASDASLRALEVNIRKLSTQLPIGANALAEIAAVAGRLGIRGTDNLTKFTEVMGKLSIATDLIGEDASTNIAKFLNVMDESVSNVDRIGAAIVELGNNFATTESAIVDFATSIAPAGRALALSSADVLGLSTALAQTGLRSEMAGTAISRIMIMMADSVAQGKPELREFARVAQMSSKQFADSFRKNPVRALEEFIRGLRYLSDEGDNIWALFEELGMSNIRVRQTMLALSGSADKMSKAINMANRAFDENAALNEEVDRALLSTWNSFKMLLNQVIEIGRGIGDMFNPVLKKLIDMGKEAVSVFNDLSESQKQNIAKWATLAAIVTGAVLALVSLAHIILTVALSFVLLTQVIGALVSPWTIGFVALLLVIGLVRSAFGEDWDSMAGPFASFCETIRDAYKTLDIQTIVDGVKTAIADLKTIWTNEDLTFGDKVIQTGSVILELGLVLFKWGWARFMDLATLIGRIWTEHIAKARTTIQTSTGEKEITGFTAALVIGIRTLWGGLKDTLAEWWNGYTVSTKGGEEKEVEGFKVTLLNGIIMLWGELGTLAETFFTSIGAWWNGYTINTEGGEKKEEDGFSVKLWNTITFGWKYLGQTVSDFVEAFKKFMAEHSWEDIQTKIQEAWDSDIGKGIQVAVSIMWLLGPVGSLIKALAAAVGLRPLAGGAAAGGALSSAIKGAARWALTIGGIVATASLIWDILPEDLKEAVKKIVEPITIPIGLKLGEMWEGLRKGLAEGDWSGFFPALSDLVSKGILIYLTLSAAKLGTTMILNAIKSGLGIVGGGIGELGVPGALGVLSVLVQLAEVKSGGKSFEDFGKQLAMALAAGIGIGYFTGSPQAGALAFTLVMNLEINWGDVTDRLNYLKESYAKIFTGKFGELETYGEYKQRRLDEKQTYEQNLRDAISWIQSNYPAELRGERTLTASLMWEVDENEIRDLLGLPKITYSDSAFILQQAISEASQDIASLYPAYGFDRLIEMAAEKSNYLWEYGDVNKIWHDIYQEILELIPQEQRIAGAIKTLSDVFKTDFANMNPVYFSNWELGLNEEQLSMYHEIRKYHDVMPSDIREYLASRANIDTIDTIVKQTTTAFPWLSKAEDTLKKIVQDYFDIADANATVESAYAYLALVISETGSSVELLEKSIDNPALLTANRFGEIKEQIEGVNTALEATIAYFQKLFDTMDDPSKIAVQWKLPGLAAKVGYDSETTAGELFPSLVGTDMENLSPAEIRRRYNQILDPLTGAGKQHGAIMPGLAGPDMFPALVAPGEAIVPSQAVRRGWSGVLDWFRSKGIPGFQTGKGPVITGYPDLDQQISSAQQAAFDMRDSLESVKEGLLTGLETVFKWLGSTFMKGLELLIMVLEELFPDHAETFKGVIEDLKGFWDRLWRKEYSHDPDIGKKLYQDWMSVIEDMNKPGKEEESAKRPWTILMESLGQAWERTKKSIKTGREKFSDLMDSAKEWMAKPFNEKLDDVLDVVAQDILNFGDAFSERSKATSERYGEPTEQLKQFGNTLMEAITPAKLVADVLNQLSVPMQALLVPITILTEAIGSALVPVFQAAFPIIKLFAQMLLFVAQAIGNAWNTLLDIISLVPFVNLSKYKMNMDALGDASKKLKDLTWEQAMEIAQGTKSMKEMNEQLRNVPSGFKVALERFSVADPIAMASGGIVTRPTYALIGEAGPEAVVPLNGRRNGIGKNSEGTVNKHEVVNHFDFSDATIYGFDDFKQRVLQAQREHELDMHSVEFGMAGV